MTTSQNMTLHDITWQSIENGSVSEKTGGGFSTSKCKKKPCSLINAVSHLLGDALSREFRFIFCPNGYLFFKSFLRGIFVGDWLLCVVLAQMF